MRYMGGPQIRIGPQITPTVKLLIFICGGVFVWSELAPIWSGSGQETLGFIYRTFGLLPADFWGKLYLWQAATYIFLHGGFFHIFFNMLVLWMFGSDLERHWGRKAFLRFFFITGIGAALTVAVASPYSNVPTIGASGSVYGILMAYGMMFPERVVHLYFLIPIKVKYFVMILIGITFLSALTANPETGTVSHIAHLGGLLFGFLYMKGFLSIANLRQAYYRRKIKRMRSRFQVYENKNPRRPSPKREDDFWIN